jgi:leucyl aminopeptidase
MTTPTSTDLLPQPSDQSLTRFQARAPELLQQVREISVLDETSYVQVCEYKLAAADILKTLTTITDQIKRTHKAALDSALNPWDRIMAPLVESKELAERKRKTYRDEQERKLKAQHIEALIRAREVAEDEQRRNAALLEAAGHAKAAAAIRDAPVNVAPTVLAPAVPKVKGIRNAKVWKVEVTDPELFVRTIGAALLLAIGPKDPAVVTWLMIEADGVTSEALAALFKGGEPANLHWLRDKVIQQREAFSMPGVSTWQE